jgi:hypothetical protein
MYPRTIAAVLLAGSLALPGCSSSSSDTSSNTPKAAASQAPMTAATITTGLAEHIPTVKTVAVYTEATDTNKRMGRPHQYLSKTAFADSRIPLAEAKKDSGGRKDAISYGGTVEVFATAADAKAWADSIDAAMSKLTALITPDYIYRSGRVVIRASNDLTPSQAKEYETALGKLVG